MKKLQQFYTLKFDSERLKNSKFRISITLDEARNNSEVITINNSEMVRALFRYKNINYDQAEVDSLLYQKSRLLKSSSNSPQNKEKINKIITRIEEILFIKDFVSIEFDNKAHYRKIVEKGGFYVNDIQFVPFLASAGMIRKNTALFINSKIKKDFIGILENGRNKSSKVVPAKFGAYFSLYSSSTLPVSFPKFAVVPDKEIETIRRVDFVTYVGEDEDDKVEEKDFALKLNAWDGQGIISPALAEKWSNELEMDYTLSCAIIRAPFLKGLVVNFDIQKFAKEVANKKTFIDIYGKEIDISEVELIVSESMFKLYSSYDSTESYVEKCMENNLGFSIAKVNPKTEISHSRTSYQFLQVLKMNEIEMANFCEPTISWFRNISGNKASDMLLYAMGEGRFEPKDFKKMDATVKAIAINPNLAKDKYIQEKFRKTLDKKKKESYMGSLLINANYQFMVSDPYYQACHIFNIADKKEPLLKDGEHYSHYWNTKRISSVTAIRSPIVHHSEFNVLNLQNNTETKKWFENIKSGIVFPANGVGIDCVIHGGSDFDGDLICTINNEPMMKSRIPGLPIVYESQKAEKEIVDYFDDKTQVDGQLNGYNSKVGFATNISSSLYAMLEEFPENSEEHKTILKRLKIGRVIQGEIIDSVKGLKVPSFRNHWTKWKRITDKMTEEEKAKWEFNNKIVCEVRPSFFRFLYPHYMTKYNKELKKYNFYSLLAFNKSFYDVNKSKEKTEKEKELINQYRKRTFFLDNNSIVNKISRYMRTMTMLIGKYSSNSSKNFDYSVLKNNKVEINPYNLIKMREYLNKYKNFKKGIRRDPARAYENIDAFVAYLKKECIADISSSESELATYAVEVTYGGEVSMVEFAWKMFPDGIIKNIVENSDGKIYIPTRDDNGEIEYLWSRYSMKEYNLGDLYEK